jgi:nucleotide-binding universal stress UspA family protein
VARHASRFWEYGDAAISALSPDIAGRRIATRDRMPTPFRRILVPDDFSEPAATALKVAADLAAVHGGRLLVLHVIVPFYPPRDVGVRLPDPNELVPAERKRLQARVARVARPRKLRAECRVVVGHPFDRIMQAARRVDSIVMATAGRTGIPRLLMGSVAEKVVRHAPVPVLTVRAASRRRLRTRARRVVRR